MLSNSWVMLLQVRLHTLHAINSKMLLYWQRLTAVRNNLSVVHMSPRLNPSRLTSSAIATCRLATLRGGPNIFLLDLAFFRPILVQW